MNESSTERAVPLTTGPAPELTKCAGPDKQTYWVAVHSRPLPGIALTDTPRGGHYALTHTQSGRALGFFMSIADAEAAVPLLDALDWTLPRSKMTPEHIQAAREVHWCEQQQTWERFCLVDDDLMTPAMDEIEAPQ